MITRKDATIQPASSHDPIDEVRLRVQAVATARHLWEWVFTHADRAQLGGNLSTAVQDGSTAGMWMRIHGCSFTQAIVDAAHAVGLTAPPMHRWLQRETGLYSDDPEEMLEIALGDADLVLSERPRAAYWEGEKIQIDWHNRPSLWNVLVTVGIAAKDGRPVDAGDFGDTVKPDYCTKKRYDLIRTEGFPLTLAARFVTNSGELTLDIPRDRIRILEVKAPERLVERVTR